MFLEASHTKNEDQLRCQAKGKCERIKEETYCREDYIGLRNISDAKLHYRTRFSMQPFAGNYSHDRKFAGSSWLCLCSESREEESHLLSGQCKVYGDLTLKYSDLTDVNNLVQFFSDVLSRRDALDKEKTTPVGVGNTLIGANSIVQ